MTSLFLFLEKHATKNKVLALFVLSNLLYAYMLLVSIPKIMTFSNGLRILDMIPTGYDLDYVNHLFNELGEPGRTAYLTTQLPIDMVYPIIFGICYCLLLIYFLKKIDKFDTSAKYFCLLPLLAGLMDYLENFGIIYLIKNYPEISAQSVNTIEWFSLTKSISTSIYFLTLLIVILLYGLSILLKKYVL